ncbi:MAG: acetolactate synthase [Gammaproteobacteria bacterium RIFCSPHIGHO2_12_FULL_35_23]|nr:MAG: acetolactate synthase [Gammaproteobacteria bacterium RIFCSPHIGHO2_12_FULL_35_23]
MKASDLFLRCLEQEGVEIIFGVPGEENADIMISLLSSKIKFITCRHEQSAAFMADMYGRLTGKPGVCLATLGPGATNLITGVANANMDHAPLIAIIGQASTSRLHKESHQNMDSITMYKPVSKWATTIREGEVIPEVVRKAFKVATEAKPGAVVIELPEDIAKIDIQTNPILPKTSICARSTEILKISTAMSMINESKYPLIIAGNGCIRENCFEQLQDFLERTGIYASVTFMGKGAISDEHPQSLLCVGLGMKDISLKAFDQADLIICIGYDLVEWPPHSWNPNADKKIIHIDTLPAEVDQYYDVDLELVGDIHAILAQLNQRTEDSHHREFKNFAKIREEIIKDISNNNEESPAPIKPQKILNDLRAILKDKDILISDVGAHKMWVARQYPTYFPKTCFIYNGFCSMGGAMPGAVVAKYLYPEKNVVALCGDGGFIMSIQALVTAVQLKLPIIVMIWEDNFYGLIKWKQEAAYHEISHVELDNPNLVKVGQAFGCHAIRINSSNELIPAIEKASMEKDKPTVIIVPVDYRENMKLTKHLGKIVAH